MITSGLGQALDVFGAHRPSGWGREPAPRAKRLPSKVAVKRRFDLYRFLDRASNQRRGPVVGVVRDEKGVRVDSANFTVGELYSHVTQSLPTPRGAGSGSIITFRLGNLPRNRAILSSLGTVRPRARLQILFQGSDAENEYAARMSEPLRLLGIQPLLALRGNRGEMIIEAGDPRHTLTLICTAERCLVMFRRSPDDFDLHTEELPPEPARVDLKRLGELYLKSEWPEKV